jgi:hypothetical protein
MNRFQEFSSFDIEDEFDNSGDIAAQKDLDALEAEGFTDQDEIIKLLPECGYSFELVIKRIMFN